MASMLGGRPLAASPLAGPYSTGGSVGLAAGSSVVSGVGNSTASSGAGSAAGVSTALGASPTGEAVGLAAGSSVVSGSSLVILSAVGSSAGVSYAIGYAPGGPAPIALSFSDLLKIHDAPGGTGVYNLGVTDVLNTHGVARGDYALKLAGGLGFSGTPTYKWIAGAIMTEVVHLHAMASPETHFVITANDVLQIATRVYLAIPASLSSGVTLHAVLQVAIGAVIAQRLGFHDQNVANTTYALAIVDALRFNQSFANFVNLSLTEGLTLHDLGTYAYSAITTLSDNVALTSALGNTIQFNLICADTVDFTDAQALSMIFQGDELLDTLMLTALYVSPSGNFTTWAMNTRTNAVTEYRNWVFNSFAAMGRKYIAADDAGLYELNGERDLTTDIQSALQTGMMQLAGTRLSGLKGIYLGMRVTQGDNIFYVKLHAGDGREYVYQMKAQPNLMTSKVNIGKGLRSRYFSFELVGTGPDFNLDTIEFVPMMGHRRV